MSPYLITLIQTAILAAFVVATAIAVTGRGTSAPANRAPNAPSRSGNPQPMLSEPTASRRGA